VTAAFPTLIVQLADNKYLLGRRFSEWTNRAPALEAAVAAAAMTQDEMGHARSLYAILQSAPDAPEAYLNEDRRAQLLGVPILEQPFQHWAEFVAAVGLFDRAMTLVLEAARDSSYEPLRQRSAKILQEEWFHRQYGEGWLRKLAAEPKTRGTMQAAVNRFWQPTADWLATLQDGSTAEGVLAESAEVLRQRWLNEIGDLLFKRGLSTP
jgi:phenylacetate-CoA oxygenase PaaI subunit